MSGQDSTFFFINVAPQWQSFNGGTTTSHQAFLTETALRNIAETTIYNLDCFEKATENKNEIILDEE